MWSGTRTDANRHRRSNINAELVVRRGLGYLRPLLEGGETRKNSNGQSAVGASRQPLPLRNEVPLPGAK